MCNAWNHSPGCTCAFGGGGYFGGSGGWSSPSIQPFAYREGAFISYRYDRSDFCRPTRCPECNEEVFFIRHNGGSVWVNPPLGWPWPKHRHCNDSESTGYRFVTDAGIRYLEIEVKPKLGRVIKRIYRNFDCVYLIDTHEGKLSALSASRYVRTVFTDLVSIRYTDDKIFLEDDRGVSVRVRNFKLTETTMQNYLNTEGEILYVPYQHPDKRPREMVTCGPCSMEGRKRQIRKTIFKRHLLEVHGIQS